MTTIAPNQFNPAKPFYPLVMNYVVQHSLGSRSLLCGGCVVPHSLSDSWDA